MELNRPLEERMSISLSHALLVLEHRTGRSFSFEDVISLYTDEGFVVPRTEQYYTTRIYSKR